MYLIKEHHQRPFGRLQEAFVLIDRENADWLTPTSHRTALHCTALSHSVPQCTTPYHTTPHHSSRQNKSAAQTCDCMVRTPHRVVPGVHAFHHGHDSMSPLDREVGHPYAPGIPVAQDLGARMPKAAAMDSWGLETDYHQPPPCEGTTTLGGDLGLFPHFMQVGSKRVGKETRNTRVQSTGDVYHSARQP